MTLATFIAEVKERLAKATRGHLTGHHSEHISKVRGLIIWSLVESIDKSIAHDGGHAWCWIEDENGSVVCQTGCGPASKANMALFGHAPTDLAKLLAVVEVYEEALKEASDKAKSKAEFTRAAFGAIADEALSRADQIVKGESHDPLPG